MYPSRASDIVADVEKKQCLSRPFMEILSAPSSHPDVSCETKVGTGPLGREDASIERIASLLLERNELTTSLSNANQLLIELE